MRFTQRDAWGRTLPGLVGNLVNARIRSMLVRYLLALLIVVLTTGSVSLLRLTISGHSATIQLLSMIGVMVTAILVGTGPAFLAALLSFLYASYFFAEPRYNFQIANIEDTVRLVAFLLTALLAGSVAAQARTHAARAERRMAESQALSTLTQIASHEPHLQQALQRMVQTVADVLPTPFCALHVTDGDGASQVSATWGTAHTLMYRETVPLTVRTHTLGHLEIAIVDPTALTYDDRRLLHLMAHQIAQSLEHDRLTLEVARAELLAESDRLKSAILSSISHDLRTPLTTIQGAVDELTATDVEWSPDHRQQLLATIKDQTHRLHDLVTNLLDLSRIRAGAVHPRKDWYALDEVILHTLDTHQSLVSHHPLTLDIPATLPLVSLDFVLTGQVLVNLLSNAVTHTPPGTSITIHAEMQENQVLVCVADCGPGIPAINQQRIFEPFYRLASVTDTQGSGIGLAICQGFVEAQGGTIWVEANPMGGARFCFTLPRDHTKFG